MAIRHYSMFVLMFLGGTGLLGAVALPLPPRLRNAPTGHQIVALLQTRLAASDPAESLRLREAEILSQVFAGNVPEGWREFQPVTLTSRTASQTNIATIFVAPNYLAVGSEDDFFLAPMTPATAQQIADMLDCSLPTRKMVDAIYAAAEVKLDPAPQPPGPAMTSLAALAAHNDTIAGARPKHVSGIIAGHKKDVVITPRLIANPGKVAIYGWHRTNGIPIQPLFLGHASSWVDYSHGIRLVQQRMILNGSNTTVAAVLADPELADILSDEGSISVPRYETSHTNNPPPLTPPTNQPVVFKADGKFGERMATQLSAPEVSLYLNAPPAEDFQTGKPVMLVFYALPNGNTTAQTIGRALQPGMDWHFDIQHIGAQTRFLRHVLTNKTIVVAYLEAAGKSWPAWVRKYGPDQIPKLVTQVRSIFASDQTEIVLSGHSGGGSFVLGYIQATKAIPHDVSRITFLDSNYAYETTNHFAKLSHWLTNSPDHALCVLAYHDSIALLDGKTFVSERGGTWGRSHAMLQDFKSLFDFSARTNAGLAVHSARTGRVQFLLKENPKREVLHTVQVYRNGFIHALLTGTSFENVGYEYLAEPAYRDFIEP